MTGATRLDPGLQLERTTLAWRRTGLSIAVGSLISIRVLPDELGSAAWMLPGATGVLGALLLWWNARRRHRRFMCRFERDGVVSVSGAGMLCAVAAGAVAVGLLSSATVVFTTLATA